MILLYTKKAPFVGAFIFGAGVRRRSGYTSHAVKTYILTQKTPIFGVFLLFSILIAITYNASISNSLPPRFLSK